MKGAICWSWWWERYLPSLNNKGGSPFFNRVPIPTVALYHKVPHGWVSCNYPMWIGTIWKNLPQDNMQKKSSMLDITASEKWSRYVNLQFKENKQMPCDLLLHGQLKSHLNIDEPNFYVNKSKVTAPCKNKLDFYCYEKKSCSLRPLHVAIFSITPFFVSGISAVLLTGVSITANKCL